MCFIPAKKIFKSINEFQPNLTGVEVLKTVYERVWVISFISLEQLFVPKGVRLSSIHTEGTASENCTLVRHQ